MRICRISQLHPHSNWPGSGLIPYNLSRDIPYPCLYVTKDLGGQPVQFPDHVCPKILSYPEATLSEKNVGRFILVATVLGKVAGYTVFLAKALPHMIRFRPQIIHIHTPLPLLLGVVGKLVFHAPLLMTFHGTDYYRFKSSRLLQYLVKIWVDTVICVSSDMVWGLKESLPGKRVVYVPNAVDTQMFRERPFPRKEQLITVSRLVWQKGFEHLLIAMKLIVAERPGLKLLIVGDGPLRGEIEKQVKSLALAQNVILTGMLNQSDISLLLSESKIFVLASVTEGFSKALLEAMACGVPAVVTDVGDSGLVAQGAGLVVPPGQPQALSDAILKLLDRRESWESASHQGAERAKQYTWKARAHKVLAEYERLLDVY